MLLVAVRREVEEDSSTNGAMRSQRLRFARYLPDTAATTCRPSRYGTGRLADRWGPLSLPLRCTGPVSRLLGAKEEGGHGGHFSRDPHTRNGPGDLGRNCLGPDRT